MKKESFKAKLLTWTLIVVMLLSVLPTGALAADSEYNATDAVSFVFTDSGITTSDTTHTSSYKIEDTALTIKASGTYLLSGSCADGSVTVKKGTTGVTLVLNGLYLTNTGSETSATAPLTCNKSTGVTIVVATGTTNALTDSIYNNDETYTANEDAENAVIKCKDGAQVSITGSGTLNVISNGKNAIKSGTTDAETDAANPRDASLTIENATLNITANVNDAINAEQELNILSGTLNITAEDDAIHSDYNLTIGSAGTTGPTINITKAYEGIEGATINICSGNISILSTDDCINAANSDLTNYNFSLSISGGTLYAYTTTGDGFDSNGSLNISGGTVEVWSANNADNQPLDADGTINISGGTVFAAGGSNGMGTKLKATQIYVTFGNYGNQKPGAHGSRQPGMQNTTIASGASVSVTNSTGAILYTATAPCNAGYVLFSSSELNNRDTYTLTTGNGESGGETDTNWVNPFVDVKESAVYYDAVLWAYYHTPERITAGTDSTHFSPTADCTRGQVVTFLWRAAGCPEPEGTCPFVDVSSTSPYYKAIIWAAEQGITNGVDATHFAPNATVTRAQFVTFLWRYEGKPEAEGTTDNFKDASSIATPFKEAVAWAVGEEIAGGYSDGTFRPNATCTRWAVVLFMYRDLA